MLENKEYDKLFRKIKNKILGKRKAEGKKQKFFYYTEKNIAFINKRKVIYTCILGEYDKVYEPLVKVENTKYIMFSNNDKIREQLNIWEYRDIPERIIKICHNDYILINRYIKMHPKELFPKDDYAAYIDGSVELMLDITELFNQINDKTGLAMHRHRIRKDVYEEAKACIKNGKGNKKQIKKQIRNYKKEKFPKKFGMVEAGIILSDLKNEETAKILDLWWNEFLERKSNRDQLALPYILWKNNYKIEDIGVLGENILNNQRWKVYEHLKK